MPLVKVYDVKREKRKILKIDNITLDEIKRVVKIKFGFECHKLVLEEDGTEIEDNDVLEEFLKKTFVALEIREKWTEAIKVDALRNTSVQEGIVIPETSSDNTEATGAAIVGQNGGTTYIPSVSSHETEPTETSTQDETVATKIKELLENRGLEDIIAHINEHKDEWQTVPVKFAVTGATGLGKSTFINAIRDVKPGQKGFAKVAGHTTRERKSYRFPGNEMIAIDDLPGYGTAEFPTSKYEEKMKLLKYDYILIFVSNISETDIELGKRLLELKVPFAFVRSKIDVDLLNCDNDGITRDEVITKMKAKSLDIRTKSGLEKVLWFLISSHDRDIGQFDELVAHIDSSLSQLKHDSFTFSILGRLSSGIIERKYEELKKRILKTVTKSFVVAALPVPGVDMVINAMIMAWEIQLYRRTFGFDQKYVRETATLREVRNRIHKNSLLIIATDWEALIEFTISALGTVGTLMTIQSATDPLLPFGCVLSGAVAGVATYRFLKRLLDRCRNDALIVYKHLADHP